MESSEARFRTEGRGLSGGRTPRRIDHILNSRTQKSPYLFASDRENDRQRQMTTAGMRAAIGKICERAGVDAMSVHVTPHVIRHTTATLALNAGMPVEQVQQMLGHSQIETTMKYIDVNQTAVKDSYMRHVV